MSANYKLITYTTFSEASIDLALWNTEAENFNDYDHPVLWVKGAKINEYGGGKSLSVIGNKALVFNPDCPEGHFLRDWFNNYGGRNVRNSISTQPGGRSMNTKWMTFREAKFRNLGDDVKPDYFQIKGTISYIKNSKLFYKACSQLKCRKKLSDMPNGQYRCGNCNVESANFKYCLRVEVSIIFSYQENVETFGMNFVSRLQNR